MVTKQVNGNADTCLTKSSDGRDYGSDIGQTENIPLQNQRPVDEASVKPLEEIEKPPRSINGPLWGIIVAGLVFANLLTSMDNTIVADIQAPIIVGLGGFKKFPWISVDFELGAACVQLFWSAACQSSNKPLLLVLIIHRGQLYGLFYKKILFISAVTIFEVGSVVCGSTTTLNAFIIGRVICGLGGTGVFTGITNIISTLTTQRERALYISISGAAWAIGAM